MHRLDHPSRSLLLAAWLVLCGSMVATSALAETISYNFNGIVTQVGSGVSSTFANPSAMYGSMTVDTSDSNSSATTGNYNIQAFQLSFSGGYTASLNSLNGGMVEIKNDFGAGDSADQFMMQVVAPNGAGVGNLRPSFFLFDLEGPSNIFTSDALPTSVPSVISFTGQDLFRLQFATAFPVDDLAISGFLTSLTPAPLPGAVVLFGIGLISLVGLGAVGIRTLRRPQA